MQPERQLRLSVSTRRADEVPTVDNETKKSSGVGIYVRAVSRYFPAINIVSSSVHLDSQET